MKLLSEFPEKGKGLMRVELLPHVPDDIWHLYNLIAVGDVIESRTSRKVQCNKHGEFNRADYGKRVSVDVELNVDCVEYDNGGLILRVLGTNRSKNHYLNFGQQHTVEVHLLRPLVLIKRVWDSVALDRLKQACSTTKQAELAVVLMQEGVANIYLVSNNVTLECSQTTTHIPFKHVEDDNSKKLSVYETAVSSFFHLVYTNLLRKVDFGVVHCVVIASPGFTNSQFYDYLFRNAEREGLKKVMKNKSSFILVRTTSAFKHSLKEVLRSPNVVNLVKDKKAGKEMQVLQEFYDMFRKSPSSVCYGPMHVQYAHEQMALQTLLITDELFRNSDAKIRKHYVELVDSIVAAKGAVRIFSSMHSSGEQLASLSGIAAILRFPLDELDDLEM